MVRSKKQMFMVIGSFLLIMVLSTTTYAYFNSQKNDYQNNINESSFLSSIEPRSGMTLSEVFLGDKESIPTIESCPGCVFTYASSELYTSWNKDEISSILRPNDYYNDYEELIKTTGKNFFLGMILESNTISRAFACGIYTDEFNKKTPFCIEGTMDGIASSDNRALLQKENLWNGTCEGESSLYCDGDIAATDGIDGFVSVGNEDNECSVDSDGILVCEVS